MPAEQFPAACREQTQVKAEQRECRRNWAKLRFQEQPGLHSMLFSWQPSRSLCCARAAGEGEQGVTEELGGLQESLLPLPAGMELG